MSYVLDELIYHLSCDFISFSFSFLTGECGRYACFIDCIVTKIPDTTHTPIWIFIIKSTNNGGKAIKIEEKPEKVERKNNTQSRRKINEKHSSGFAEAALIKSYAYTSRQPDYFSMTYQ